MEKLKKKKTSIDKSILRSTNWKKCKKKPNNQASEHYNGGIISSLMMILNKTCALNSLENSSNVEGKKYFFLNEFDLYVNCFSIWKTIMHALILIIFYLNNNELNKMKKTRHHHRNHHRHHHHDQHTAINKQLFK